MRLLVEILVAHHFKPMEKKIYIFTHTHVYIHLIISLVDTKSFVGAKFQIFFKENIKREKNYQIALRLAKYKMI